MNELQIIERNNQRVLLTSQLAENYDTTEKVISNNFNNNNDRYQEGRHYYCLEGEDLKEFLQSSNLGTQNTSKIRLLYLWTEKGALLHAKSLNTDKAWEVYDRLVETYFNVQQQSRPLTQAELALQQAQLLVSMERKVKEVEQATEKISNKLDTAIDIFAKPLDSSWRDSMNARINKMCVDFGLNYQVFKGDLYAELEQIAHCDLTARQTRLRGRLKEAGATYREQQAISKIDIVERDPKLKAIFESIVRKYQVRYIA